MKHIYITCLLLLSAFALANASQDNRAKTILDHTADAYRKAGGIHILFGGTQQGILLLKGECFYLECGGVRRENPMELRGTKRGSDHIEPFSRRAAKHQSVCPYQFVCLPIRLPVWDTAYDKRETRR